jgi:hypothetical protein
MAGKAAEIDRQAENAIYSDDADAVERLTEKIAALEAKRARIKTVNALIRKVGLVDAGEQLTAEERAELLTLIRLCPYHHCETRGFPPYHLTNLGGNINRLKARLASLSGGTLAPQGPLPGDTATARAGLRVSAGMTTPSRAGKAPRQVWTVTGNLAFWRPLLTNLGGTWYRGAFSFWEDPTADLDTACAESETESATRELERATQ